MAAESKIYLFDEVAKHNETEDCWLIIYGKVYDVTPFMEEHPGGPEVLLAATGKDATSDYEDVGHSDPAKEMLHKYYIGEVDISTVPLKRNYFPAQTTSHSSEKSNEFVVRILRYLVPVMILGLAFLVRTWTKVD